MKIIFLDIDGVLNNQLWFAKTKGKRKSGKEVDPINVENLNRIVKQTNAKVVVTSTWRFGETVESLQTLLKQAGFRGKVAGFTLSMRVGRGGDDCILRGNEILHWVKRHKSLVRKDYWEYKNYVILDDDSDMLYWQRNNFILVDPYVGLTPTIAYRAVKILNQ